MAIPVFYRTEMSWATSSSNELTRDKSATVVADWQASPSIASSISIETFDPVAEQTISLAHYPAYVKSVLSCQIDNGFGNKDLEIAQSLPFTVGSMVAAARYALENRSVAISPSSEFHHAHYTHGEKFCTFNGLMVAALEMKRLGLVRNVLVIDGDAHFGDGTDSCVIAARSWEWIKQLTAGRDYTSSDVFFRRTNPKALYGFYQQMWTDIGSTLVLYQAGANAWEHDSQGAGFFTMKELKMRDERIFALARLYHVPLVVNLAGGYPKSKDGHIDPVLKIHRQTMQSCIDIYNNRR